MAFQKLLFTALQIKLADCHDEVFFVSVILMASLQLLGLAFPLSHIIIDSKLCLCKLSIGEIFLL